MKVFGKLFLAILISLNSAFANTENAGRVREILEQVKGMEDNLGRGLENAKLRFPEYEVALNNFEIKAKNAHYKFRKNLEILEQQISNQLSVTELNVGLSNRQIKRARRFSNRAQEVPSRLNSDKKMTTYQQGLNDFITMDQFLYLPLSKYDYFHLRVASSILANGMIYAGFLAMTALPSGEQNTLNQSLFSKAPYF